MSKDTETRLSGEDIHKLLVNAVAQFKNHESPERTAFYAMLHASSVLGNQAGLKLEDFMERAAVAWQAIDDANLFDEEEEDEQVS